MSFKSNTSTTNSMQRFWALSKSSTVDYACSQSLSSEGSTDSGVSITSSPMSSVSDESEASTPSMEPTFRRISSSELANLISERHDINDVLLLDCRNFVDFNHAHVKNSINVLYSKIMRKRLIESKVCCSNLVNQHLKTLEENNPSSEHNIDVIIYAGDDSKRRLANYRQFGPCKLGGLRCGTASKELFSEDCADILFEKLQTSDVSLQCRQVLRLEGSFLEFSTQFPDLCESNEHSVHSTSIESAPLFLNDSRNNNAVNDIGMNWLASGGKKNLGLSLAHNPSTPSTSTTSMTPTTLSPPSRLALASSQSHPCLSAESRGCLPPPMTPCSQAESARRRPNAGLTKIFEHVYLGSQDDALNEEGMKARGITRIINLSENGPCPSFIPEDAEHFYRIPIKDSYNAKLLEHFETAFKFIDKAKNNNEKVLLHCLAGISRSATLAVGYVMHLLKRNTDEAYAYVKNQRPSISPNFNFMGQLLEYEKQLIARGTIAPPSKKALPEESATSSTDTLAVPSPILKSASAEAVGNLMRDVFTNENGKRTIDAPLTFPGRPRQLMKTDATTTVTRPGSIPLSPLSLPGHEGELPSPSTEFKRLDISNLAFPTLPGLTTPTTATTPTATTTKTTKTELSLENPMFSLSDPRLGGAAGGFPGPGPSASASPSNKQTSWSTPMVRTSCGSLLRYFKRNSTHILSRSKPPTTTTTSGVVAPPTTPITSEPCSARCVRVPQGNVITVPTTSKPRRHFRRPFFTGSNLKTVTDLPDDEAAESSSSSATETAVASSSPYRDPERESIGSTSSHEIAVN